MSIEVTLQNIADALNNLAEANRACAEATLATNAGYTASVQAYAVAAGKTEAQKHEESGATDEEIDAAVAKVEADAKPNATRAVIEQKLAEARAAKNAASAAGTATAAADTQSTAGAADTATDGAQTSYDYAKDVQPLLVKVGKNRDQLVALLKSFGAAKGADIKPADYAAVIAKANELIAG